jgi:hypothetical protein
MIKNRESASLSRKRRKDVSQLLICYVASLANVKLIAG